jgi:hypothetical protein
MNERKVDTGAVIAGLILLAVGTMMLIDRFTDRDFGDLIQSYWPMILVLVGVPKLFRYESLWSGLWLVALGVWMQLVHLHVFGLSWRNSWPLLLIVLGVGTIARALFDVIVPREGSHER